ncbi:mammalian cell entry protein [Mycolicibacterium moriokaense]|uniref:Mce/MlaD domain-containing protein n=1 Tax=Mycolicibacterium moriokaense TaxID=39691 RepID=A0AAD1H8C4_9MYCO|nr:MlaD family protein [Mycolicibacterium moriokaense]MCV7039147.1 MCE family protein [Mycolicibacterium moriokaense]ORB18565.1 mammalian cell entry protein [Mycolicibacterium moriokaense]BBX00050.1 hypothetical protein MMOR_09860 [Mycolicibacterium moriokaense]
MKLRDILSFTVFGLITAFAISYIGSFGVRVGPPEHRTNLSMSVPDINGLVADASVLLRGVAVGKVTRIESAVDHATVHFYVDGAYPIPVDSDVRLDNLSALGEAYIGLLPRTDTGPVLQDGQHIATEAVHVPPAISELATSVVRVLDQLDPDQLQRIIGEADTALPDPKQVLPNLERASLVLRNMADSRNGRGQQVLENFQTLLRNASWAGPTLADVAPRLRDTGEYAQSMISGMSLVVIDNNPEHMARTGDLLDRIQGFLDDRGPDIKVLAQALLPKFHGIGGALMNFDTAQILENALAATPEDGAITLHVTIPEN